MPAKDMTGYRFGKLTVVREIRSRDNKLLCVCICDCGRTKTVARGQLTGEHTRSCGCLRGVNEFTHLADGTTVLTITRGNGDKFECFIDTADYDIIRRHRWHVFKSKGKHTFYVATDGRKPDGSRQSVFMHRLILPSVEQVDHKDRNGLNNRRSNLRPATQSLNNANTRKIAGGTSKYRGVHWSAGRRRFVASITMDKKLKWLGEFDNEEAAAIMYNIFAKMYFGEFASLNQFPKSAELAA